MLDEYFSITIDTTGGTGRVTSLPGIVPDHLPEMEQLPRFLLRLATEVDWQEETACFDGISLELARFYCELPRLPTSMPASDGGANVPVPNKHNSALRLLRLVLFPAYRMSLIPPCEFADDGSIRELVRLENLYKVFERC
jgi:DNA mismatch repair protein MLH1